MGDGVGRPVLVRTMRDNIDTVSCNDELVPLNPSPVFYESGLNLRSIPRTSALIAKQQARHPTSSLQGTQQVPCNPCVRAMARGSLLNQNLLIERREPVGVV